MATRTARGVLVAVLVAAAMLLLLDLRGAGPADALRGLTGAAVGGPERALSWARTEAGARLRGSADEQARVAALEDELLQARIALGERAAEQTNAAAEALGAALPIAGYTLVHARVVARSAPQDLTDAVTISAGSDAGIAPGMVVIDSAGVVGVVASVAPQVSTLRLSSDPGTRLAARVRASKEAGVLSGTGEGVGELTLLDPLGAMRIGDAVLTIGTGDGTVPADLPLGTITTLDGSAADLTRAAQVALHVDRSTLDRVAVLVPQGQR